MHTDNNVCKIDISRGWHQAMKRLVTIVILVVCRIIIIIIIFIIFIIAFIFFLSLLLSFLSLSFVLSWLMRSLHICIHRMCVYKYRTLSNSIEQYAIGNASLDDLENCIFQAYKHCSILVSVQYTAKHTHTRTQSVSCL